MTTIVLGGDVMTGRGVDQRLPHPGRPELYEDNVRDAREYVALAEARAGPVPPLAPPDHCWGAALPVLRAADVRLVNLETAITTAAAWDRHKRVHYRMHPSNVGVLASAQIDVVSLANNHVLDWGPRGLIETCAALDGAGVRYVGAGPSQARAEAALHVPAGSGRAVHVVARAHRSSGVPDAWAATSTGPGVALLEALSDEEAGALARAVRAGAAAGDTCVVSIHWGPNWGFHVDPAERRFAHALIDGGVDVVHGHSSHHPRPIELYRGRPILYGCGDLINDYEGIEGHDDVHPELVLLVRVQLTPAMAADVTLVPMRIARMRLVPVHATELRWIEDTLRETSAPLGTAIHRTTDGTLRVSGA